MVNRKAGKPVFRMYNRLSTRHVSTTQAMPAAKFERYLARRSGGI